jgi:GGDEF domain-containing protein
MGRSRSPGDFLERGNDAVVCCRRDDLDRRSLRPVRRGIILFGAAFWLAACFVPAFTGSAAARLVVSALIVAGYTILTAAELRLERRKSLIRRWPAIFVPTLHGAIFLLPVALATLSPGEDGGRSLAQGWIVVFAIEVVLYLVGTAFIVLILAKDRTVNVYKTTASTDALTGVLNRRGFFEAASMHLARNRRGTSPVSVLAFDLDHFKLINDRCGHIVGDAVLESFARVARETLRSGDILGRLWEARNSSLFFPPRSRTPPSPPSACDLHSPQPASFATVSGSRRLSVSAWRAVRRR